MQEPFTSVINSVLSVGHGLPIPKQFKGELSKTRLFTYDHFLMIESDPRIEKRVTEKEVKVGSLIRRELFKFLRD